MKPIDVKKLQKRHDGIVKLLAEVHPEVHQQRHLNAGTPERAYWHYGYAVAINDILNMCDDSDPHKEEEIPCMN